MGVVLTGAFAVLLDTTIVNVALAEVGNQLEAPAHVEWVVTAYLLSVGLAQLAAGWLMDRFGKKTAFSVSLAFFGLGSLLAALAPNLQTLVAFRVLQGLGGGAMVPVSMAMIYELFPPNRRATALGVWGIAAMAAPAIGPVVGGWIATTVSWRWVFAINVPIAIVGVVLATMLLRDVGYREHRRLDWSTLALAGMSLSIILIAFDQVIEWGWGEPAFWGLTGLGLAGLVGFVIRELASGSPLLEMRMFTVPAFAATIGIVWLITAAQFARLVIMPVELQVVHGMTPMDAGLVLAPAAVGTAATMPIGGRIADRIGPRTPVFAGLAVIAVALWAMAHLSVNTARSTIVWLLVLQGTGFGLAIMPNTVTAMNVLPARYTARAAAVRSLNRQVASSLGVALLVSIVALQIGTLTGDEATTPASAQEAYNSAFLVAFSGAVVAMLLALRLPGRREISEIQAERESEYVDVMRG